MICGALKWTSGTVRVFGLDVTENEIALKKRMGIIPERQLLFDQLTCEEQIVFTASLYGLSPQTAEMRMQEMLDLFQLADHRHKRIGDLSQGMARKVSFICATIHDPELLILDEPWQGLDPVAFQLVQDHLKQFISRGRTMVITSHNLSVVQNIANRMILIDAGRIILDSLMHDLPRHAKSITDSDYPKDLQRLYLELIDTRKHRGVASWLKQG
jgi:ABC-2 type transport system ATP-binding protein